VRLAAFPQILVGPVIVTVGTGKLVNVWQAEAVQPFEAVPTTQYVVVFAGAIGAGVTATKADVALLAFALHRYELAPVARIVALWPVQSEAGQQSNVMATAGAGRTVTAEQELAVAQPFADVAVTQ
jgi:hypothetical protein